MFALRFISESPIDSARVRGNASTSGSDRWQHNEGLLSDLDDRVFTFAAEKALMVRQSGGGWPCRTLEWTDGVRRMIQIYLEDEAVSTFTLSICATQDRRHERFFKALALREAVPLAELRREFDDLLDASHRLLRSWTAADLEFSISLDRDGPRAWTRHAGRTKPWQTSESKS